MFIHLTSHNCKDNFICRTKGWGETVGYVWGIGLWVFLCVFVFILLYFLHCLQWPFTIFRSKIDLKPVVKKLLKWKVLKKTSNGGCFVLQKSGSGETEIEVISYVEEPGLEVLEDLVFWQLLWHSENELTLTCLSDKENENCCFSAKRSSEFTEHDSAERQHSQTQLFKAWMHLRVSSLSGVIDYSGRPAMHSLPTPYTVAPPHLPIFEISIIYLECFWARDCF